MRSLLSARWLVAVAASAAGTAATVGCGTSNSSSSPPPDGSGAQDASGSSSGGGGSGSGSGGSSSGSGSGGSVVDGGGSGSSGGSTGDGGSGDGGASAGIDGGPDGSNDSGGASGRMQAVYMTFYGWPDNSPPGGAIAYPKSGFPTVHNVAGGTGTYADPITYATDMAELPVGTLVYAPVIKKYIVMEDDCAQCDTDWAGSKKWHIDVWMNSNAAASSSAVLACENQWTQTSTVVEVTPPPGRAVTAPPLFDTSTNTCRTSP